MSKVYGLIGKNLKHSFSRDYFEKKFEKEEIQGCQYKLFELENCSELSALINENPSISGLNVTIPYKKEVISIIDDLDESAFKVGAVNVIKLTDNQLIGYNSDYFGFHQSLLKWVKEDQITNLKSIVLGTGGASNAVCAVLEDLGIYYQKVSRTSNQFNINYESISSQVLQEHQLIINTTPIGMFPNVASKPRIPYHLLTGDHWLYDLVYNPDVTEFMREGEAHGAMVKNGLEMLHLQAEKSWEIWNS